jgi:hypothetical protein
MIIILLLAAKVTNIPVLVIHDNNDVEVPVKAGIHIHNYLKTEHYFFNRWIGTQKNFRKSKVIEKQYNSFKTYKQNFKLEN